MSHHARVERPLLCVAFTCWLFTVPAVASPTDDGIAQYQAGRFGDAATVLGSALKATPDDARAAAWLGRAQIELGDHDAAIEALERAVELDSGNSDYQHRLGQALGVKARNANVLRQATLAPQIRRQFERAIELDAGNLDAVSDLISYYLEAPAMFGGDVGRARELAASVLAKDRARGLGEVARVHESAGEVREAESTYRTAIAEFPSLPRPRLALAYLLQRQKRWADAFAALEALAAVDGQQDSACYQIGRTAALSGQNLERGSECLTQYLRSPPRPGMPPATAAHFRLGQVHAHAGRTEQARAAFEETLRLDADHEDAKKALREL